MSTRATPRVHPETGKVWCDCPGCRGGAWRSWRTFYRHTDARTAAAASVPQAAVQPSSPAQPSPAAPASLPGPSNVQKRPNPVVSNDDTPNKREKLELEAIEEGGNDIAMMDFDNNGATFDDDAPTIDLDPASAQLLDDNYESDSDIDDAPEPGSLADQSNLPYPSDVYLDPESDTDTDEDSDAEAGESNRMQHPEARLQDLRWAQQFQEGVRAATLENSGLDEASIQRIREPPNAPLDLSDPDIKLAIRLFLDTIHNGSSEDVFNGIRLSILDRHPDDPVLNLDATRKEIARLTGVFALNHEKCHNNCVAFTGPFEKMKNCPDCGLARVNEKGEVCKFKTMPLGPQIQALMRSKKTATIMQYRVQETARVEAELQANDGYLQASLNYNDLFGGSSYRAAVERGDISPKDIAVIGSIDGAQLYRNKQSDCWISIWIVANLPPEKRYKKIYVLPDFIIGGPKKPKNMDSFSYPSVHHLSAIQKEGLSIWDAATDTEYISRPYLLLQTADGPALATRNGLVGHTGAITCRIPCPLPGRHNPNISMNYPVLKKPNNYKVAGCDHDDVDPRTLGPRTEEQYRADLKRILMASSTGTYNKARKETGISKPSIFDGLLPKHHLGITELFPSDLMHWSCLNWTELMLALFRGTIDCEAPDSKTDWPWMCLTGDAWKEHGKEVESTTPYLPGSFDRPPRNPAEKISSGYKAWEWLLYVIGMGPVLYKKHFPAEYWRHFCKAVHIIRVFHQHPIPSDQLTKAHERALEYVVEFEDLFYKRMPERLHFVRPSIHSFIHLAPECCRIGPQCTYSQWTMERTIGIFGGEVRQPSNPFANLSEVALRYAQVNALYAMDPDLDRKSINKEKLPRYSLDLGNEYILLRRRDRYPITLKDKYEIQAICTHLGIPAKSKLRFKRWARLRLPNGQIARSVFGEENLSLQNVRKSSCVKINNNNQPWIIEVSYYFVANDVAYALGRRFPGPDIDLLRESYGTVWAAPGPARGRIVFSVSRIQSVVAMIPYNLDGKEIFFLVEKPGLEMATMGGFEEDDDEGEGPEDE